MLLWGCVQVRESGPSITSDPCNSPEKAILGSLSVAVGRGPRLKGAHALKGNTVLYPLGKLTAEPVPCPELGNFLTNLCSCLF